MAETQRTPSRFPWMGCIKSGDDLLSRCSHYHRPQVLNGRVRNGNGCGHLGMVTGKLAGNAGSRFPTHVSKRQRQRVSSWLYGA